jgi:N-methylhydantoinase B
VANRAHHADVGGEAPGSMPAHATRLEQEGHIVPPVLAVIDGEWEHDFVSGFVGATRTPVERLGDLSAQMGSNEAGARRLLEVQAAYGSGYDRITSALLGYGENRMRAALRALPDVPSARGLRGVG